MKLLHEFRKFIARGNVVDLAVAVVVGAAFNKIVTALVDGMIMPLIATLSGGLSVDDWKYVVKPARVGPAGKQLEEVAFLYGHVLQTVIDFLLISFVVFTLLQGYNRLRERDEAEKKKKDEADEKAKPPADEVVLLREIRDLLKARAD